MKYTAIVLAAGTGKRMHTNVHKQYLTLAGRPVLYYALRAFADSDVTDIVLVVGQGETAYCRSEIVEKYGIGKVSAIVEGGKERYHSVYEGLKAAKDADYVLIHDGARPLVDSVMIRRMMDEVAQCDACVAGMPVKDTIKIADEEGYVSGTPDRSRVWQIQTPQAFSFPLIRKAYEQLLMQENVTVTDDAMVLEQMTRHRTKLVEGSYCNIKITTPEDLAVAETYLEWKQKNEKNC
ncbi:MAG: 2-C-methyl-D-erythritol 4-phosphate cytidylyltransferase [Roseburia sp.]